MQNTVDERKQNGDDFFLSLAVTYFRSGNCPANGLVTEQPQYSVAICFFTTWQNTETMLISNGLRFIFICSLSLALPCIFHQSRHSYATTICLSNGVPIETLSKLMGHTSIRSTQIYAKITAEKVSNDIENLSKQIESMESFICKAI
jgi:hypothetical protein